MTKSGSWLIVWTSFLALTPAWKSDPTPEPSELPNDTIENATVVESLPFSGRGIDLTDASREATDPACGGSLGTVWYRFTAARDMPIVLWVSDPLTDPPGPMILGVYRGTPGNLETIQCQSRFPMRLDTEGGETYYLMVAGASLHVTLGLEAAQSPSDIIENAVAIQSERFSGYFDLTGMTAGATDPPCGHEGVTVWYRFTPTRSLRLQVYGTAMGHSPGSSVGVYGGMAGNLEPIVCGDDSAMFQATAGETYHFMVRAPGDLLHLQLSEITWVRS